MVREHYVSNKKSWPVITTSCKRENLSIEKGRERDKGGGGGGGMKSKHT